MKAIMKLVEKIFPERSDHKLVREAKPNDLLSRLQPTDHQNFISLLNFKEPLVKAAVHEAKFHNNELAWERLGGVLSQYLKHCPAGTVLIPIPLSAKRKRSRGYNQVLEVAKRGIATTHITLNDRLLYRRRDTAPQTSLQKAERLKNVTEAFGVRDLTLLTNTHIIILDDVATTGATLKAAETTLRPLHPASITCLALAH